jgi:hypothetical protein
MSAGRSRLQMKSLLQSPASGNLILGYLNSQAMCFAQVCQLLDGSCCCVEMDQRREALHVMQRRHRYVCLALRTRFD